MEQQAISTRTSTSVPTDECKEETPDSSSSTSSSSDVTTKTMTIQPTITPTPTSSAPLDDVSTADDSQKKEKEQNSQESPQTDQISVKQNEQEQPPEKAPLVEQEKEQIQSEKEKSEETIKPNCDSLTAASPTPALEDHNEEDKHKDNDIVDPIVVDEKQNIEDKTEVLESADEPRDIQKVVEQEIQLNSPDSIPAEHKEEMTQIPVPKDDNNESMNPFGDDEEEENETTPKEDASLNPFGEFDSEEEESDVVVRATSPNKPIPPVKPAFLCSPVPSNNKVLYPKECNPFGDDEEELDISVDIKTSNELSTTIDSLNPFGEFDSEEEMDVSYKSAPTTITRPSPTPTPRKSLLTPTMSNQPVSKSPQSMRKSPKKARAPLPPGMVRKPEKEESDSLSSHPEDDKISLVSSNSSTTPSTVLTSRTPTPTARRNKVDDSTPTSETKEAKMKKRSAPPIPAIKREVKTSTNEIEEELDQIGDKLPGIETKRAELEEFLLSTQSALGKEDANNDEEYKKKKDEFIDVAKQRCKLSQRQKELMYKKSEAKLEQQQMDIEFRLRKIMSKQDALKTDDDHKDEAQILKELMDVIDDRNDIIENMIRDENKEIEEFIRIIEKVLPEEAKALTPSGLNGSQSDLRPSKSISASKLLKKKTANTLSLLKLKKKKKEAKETKETTKSEANENEKQQKTHSSEQQNGEKKKRHFSLGKGTLRKFTSSKSKLKETNCENAQQQSRQSTPSPQPLAHPQNDAVQEESAEANTKIAE